MFNLFDTNIQISTRSPNLVGAAEIGIARFGNAQPSLARTELNLDKVFTAKPASQRISD